MSAKSLPRTPSSQARCQCCCSPGQLPTKPSHSSRQEALELSAQQSAPSKPPACKSAATLPENQSTLSPTGIEWCATPPLARLQDPRSSQSPALPVVNIAVTTSRRDQLPSISIWFPLPAIPQKLPAWHSCSSQEARSRKEAKRRADEIPINTSWLRLSIEEAPHTHNHTSIPNARTDLVKGSDRPVGGVSAMMDQLRRVWRPRKAHSRA